MKDPLKIIKELANLINFKGDLNHAYQKTLDWKKENPNHITNNGLSNAWNDIFNLQDIYPATIVDENDIYQIYAGLMCKHYILSESTFHLWISYLGTINDDNKKVIIFNNTDITNRNLSLDNWIKINSH